ncbi:hypothetical protein [Tranquillimonas rosea]|uniref:hypothetical protein n=1 Tax=Tranquillimonas rosea TaxID=641238 RepID=UPI003BAB69EF
MMTKPYIGPIPAASVDRAAGEYGEEAEAFRRCIRAMDSAFLEVVRDDGPKVDTSRTFGPDLMADAGRVSR